MTRLQGQRGNPDGDMGHREDALDIEGESARIFAGSVMNVVCTEGLTSLGVWSMTGPVEGGRGGAGRAQECSQILSGILRFRRFFR